MAIQLTDRPTAESPIVAAARVLLHRGDDGGAPVNRNDVGFNGADYGPVRRLLWQIDRSGQASPNQLAAIGTRLLKYKRQLAEVGFDPGTVFSDAQAMVAAVNQAAVASNAYVSGVAYAAFDEDDVAGEQNATVYREFGEPERTMPRMEEILGPGGVIARALPGYEPRPQQIQLSQAIADAIAAEEHLLGEAGTGVGKSMAYLIPAICSGLKVIVSTEGKALQDQLVKKDLPFLQQHLPVPFTFACLKGLSNYLCLAKYQEELGNLGLFGATDEWNAIRAWQEGLAEGASGDLAEAPLTPSPELLARITSTTEECIGKDCPQYARCYAQRARAAAKNARVLVVNHTLLALDLSLRAKTDDGVGVLPDRDVVVVDEAHALEDVATKAFTRELGQFGVQALCKSKQASAAELDPEKMARAVTAAAEFFAALGLLVQGDRSAVVIAPNPELRRRAQAVADALAPLAEKARQKSCDPLKDQVTRARLERFADRLRERADLFAGILEGLTEHLVLFVERELTRKGESRVSLKLAPVSVAADLHDALWSRWPTIATSATLTAVPVERGGSPLGYFRERVGVQDGRELVVESPFDYRRNALVYLPEPGYEFDPSRYYQDGSVEYLDRLAGQVERLLLASDGRAFVLFTSRRVLDEVHSRVAHRLRWNVLKQGEASPQELVRRFKEDGAAVLFGLRSFWTGVDVQGDALSLVIIDKLPFPTPDEPVYQARCEALNRKHGDRWAWFQRLAIPICCIQYKQGFGRLIRTQTDTGVVALLDGRLTSKGYGTGILNALPPAPRTRSLDTVRTFFAQWRAA